MFSQTALTQKDHEKLVGQMYVFDRFNADFSKRFWRFCLKNRGCKARMHTDTSTSQVSSL